MHCFSQGETFEFEQQNRFMQLGERSSICYSFHILDMEQCAPTKPWKNQKILNDYNMRKGFFR
jgi:hypothetical protein